MSARDLPFPSLVAQGVIKEATTPETALITDSEPAMIRTGGLDLNASFQPRFEESLCDRLYCAAISFLLHKLPFVQGITSSYEIGKTVSQAILSNIGETTNTFAVVDSASFGGIIRQ